MTKLFTTIAVLAMSASAAFAECTAPETPDFPEDGATMSRQDMAKMFRSVKTFQAALADYRECLDAERSKLGAARVNKLHNASVDAEEEVAKKFNTAFTAFKKNSQAR